MGVGFVQGSSYSKVASESVSNNNITGPTIFFNKRIISQILLIFKGISKDWLCLLSSEAIQIISSPTIFKLAANPDVLN